EVIVRAVGSDLRWDYTAVGMPTHIAARLEQVAAPGAILASRETLQLAEREIDSRPLGRVTVKGVPEGLEAYEILGLRSRTEPSVWSVTPALSAKLSTSALRPAKTVADHVRLSLALTRRRSRAEPLASDTCAGDVDSALV